MPKNSTDFFILNSQNVSLKFLRVLLHLFFIRRFLSKQIAYDDDDTGAWSEEEGGKKVDRHAEHEGKSCNPIFLIIFHLLIMM